MKQKLYNKLRSQTGASITFALLLFLVCATVGAIVLAAGTAAAGRVGKLAEMDRRYYSVTSAADLLADELSGKSVTITRTRVVTSTDTTPYTYTTDGNAGVTKGTPSHNDSTVFTTSVANGTPISAQSAAVSTDGMSFLTTRAVKLMFGSNPCNTAAAMDYSFASGSAETDSFTMTHDLDYLAVNGEYELQTDGTLVLTLQDTVGNDHYTLRMTLSPAITETESSAKETSTATTQNADGKGYQETVTTTTTTTKESTITWTVSSVEKVVAKAAAGTTGGGSGG